MVLEHLCCIQVFVWIFVFISLGSSGGFSLKYLPKAYYLAYLILLVLVLFYHDRVGKQAGLDPKDLRGPLPGVWAPPCFCVIGDVFSSHCASLVRMPALWASQGYCED